MRSAPSPPAGMRDDLQGPRYAQPTGGDLDPGTKSLIASDLVARS